MNSRTFFVALLAVASIAQAADPVKAQIEANYAAITVAFQHNDIGGITKFLAPDFTVKPPQGGVIGREKMIADYKRQMANMHDVTWDRKVTKLTHVGRDVDVMVSGHFVGSFKDESGKVHKFDLHSTADDLWTPNHGSWLLKRSNALKLDAKVDGKAPGG